VIFLVHRKKSNTSSTLLADPDRSDEEVSGSNADVLDTPNTTIPTAANVASASNSHEDNEVRKHSMPISSKKSSSDSLMVTPVSATETPNRNTIVGEKDEPRSHLLNNQHFQATSRKGEGPLDRTATLNKQQPQGFQNSPLNTGHKKEFKTG